MLSNGIPYLTIDDKINMAFFEPQKAALIIEGKDDYHIYSRILSRLDINEMFDIVVGFSKSNILKHHDSNKINFSYLILLDADYDHFKNSCRSDPQIVYTHFYTMENYLTTKEVIKATVNDFRNVDNLKVDGLMILEKSIKALIPYTVACIMKLRMSWDIKIEDHKIFRWWDENTLKINEDTLKNYIIQELNSHGKIIESSYYDELYMKGLKKLKEFPTDKIDCIIHGKRKLEVVFCYFKYFFPNAFENRNERVFKFDLLKNIFASSYILNLLNEIDNKMKYIITSNKAGSKAGNTV